MQLVSSPGRRRKDAIAELHDAGVLVMPTVGARRHAEKMLEWGVDAVIAQGGEGGGHTGTVPTSLLLPQVVDAVGAHIPVLGAGGFHDGRGLVAALAYGADGIAMGTRFLLTAGEPRARRREGPLPRGVGRSTPWSPPRSTVRRSGSSAPTWSTGSRRPRPSPASRRRCADALRLPQGDRHLAQRPRARGPGHAQEPGPHVEPARHGRQRPDADQGDDGRRRARGRRAAHRPGRPA